MNKKRSVVGAAFGDYAGHLGPFFALSFAYIVVITLVILIGTLLPIVLFALLPFILIPFLFAFIVVLHGVGTNQGPQLRDFNKLLVPGLHPFLRRMLHPYRSLLKAFVISFAVLFLLSLLVTSLAPSVAPELAVTLDELIELMDTAPSLTVLDDFLVTHENELYGFLAASSLLTALATFMSLASDFSGKILGMLFGLDIPMALEQLDQAHRAVYPKFRFSFLWHTVKYQWPSYLAFFAGCGFGAWLLVSLRVNPILIGALALGLGVLASGFLFPHYVIVVDAFYEKMAPSYFEFMRPKIKALLGEIDKAGEIPAEIKESLRKTLKERGFDPDDDHEKPPEQ